MVEDFLKNIPSRTKPIDETPSYYVACQSNADLLEDRIKKCEFRNDITIIKQLANWLYWPDEVTNSIDLIRSKIKKNENFVHGFIIRIDGSCNFNYMKKQKELRKQQIEDFTDTEQKWTRHSLKNIFKECPIKESILDNEKRRKIRRFIEGKQCVYNKNALFNIYKIEKELQMNFDVFIDLSKYAIPHLVGVVILSINGKNQYFSFDSLDWKDETLFCTLFLIEAIEGPRLSKQISESERFEVYYRLYAQ